MKPWDRFNEIFFTESLQLEICQSFCQFTYLMNSSSQAPWLWSTFPLKQWTTVKLRIYSCLQKIVTFPRGGKKYNLKYIYIFFCAFLLCWVYWVLLRLKLACNFKFRSPCFWHTMDKFKADVYIKRRNAYINFCFVLLVSGCNGEQMLPKEQGAECDTRSGRVLTDEAPSHRILVCWGKGGCC